eukprot:c14319_g1_i2.p1 GENE.c14319_g1_i2~~c14319_g1_i2.p1  ORF type:complete len:228 (+),score=56.35 c14319_g1_i2:259-942(+)
MPSTAALSPRDLWCQVLELAASKGRKDEPLLVVADRDSVLNLADCAAQDLNLRPFGDKKLLRECDGLHITPTEVIHLESEPRPQSKLLPTLERELAMQLIGVDLLASSRNGTCVVTKIDKMAGQCYTNVLKQLFYDFGVTVHWRARYQSVTMRGSVRLPFVSNDEIFESDVLRILVSIDQSNHYKLEQELTDELVASAPSILDRHIFTALGHLVRRKSPTQSIKKDT